MQFDEWRDLSAPHWRRHRVYRHAVMKGLAHEAAQHVAEARKNGSAVPPWRLFQPFHQVLFGIATEVRPELLFSHALRVEWRVSMHTLGPEHPKFSVPPADLKLVHEFRDVIDWLASCPSVVTPDLMVGALRDLGYQDLDALERTKRSEWAERVPTF